MLSATFNPPRLTVVSPPTVEPLTLTEMISFLHANPGDEDDLITSLIVASRAVFERLTSRALIETELKAFWDVWPRAGTYAGACVSREIELPIAPLISVESVKYLDVDGTEQTVDPADYTVEDGLGADQYGRIRLTSAAAVPDLGDFPGALRINFTAGHGAAATDVPDLIRAALRLLVSHLYANRVLVNIGNIVNEIPFGLKALIEMHQIRGIA